MTNYVLDASVAVRFLLSETLSDEAAHVLRDYIEGHITLEAPRLMIYEVGNALWRATKETGLGIDGAEDRFSRFFDLNISTTWLERDDHRDILAWAHSHDATYYDAAYAVAARKRGAILLTADHALHQKASVEQPTMTLKNYPSREGG